MNEYAPFLEAFQKEMPATDGLQYTTIKKENEEIKTNTVKPEQIINI